MMWERNIDGHLPTGDQPATQACAPTRNRPSDLLLWRTMSNQLSHTGKGLTVIYMFTVPKFIPPVLDLCLELLHLICKGLVNISPVKCTGYLKFAVSKIRVLVFSSLTIPLNTHTFFPHLRKWKFILSGTQAKNLRVILYPQFLRTVLGTRVSTQ